MTRTLCRLVLSGLLAGCAAPGPVATPPPSAAAPVADLGRTLSVEESPSVFTLFAMLNTAGYDVENSQVGMHPARLEVRRALESKLPQDLRSGIRAFYQEHSGQATPWHYSVVALSTSGPPDFRPGAEWTTELSRNPQFSALAPLPGILRDFYAAADVPSLYAAVRPQYLAYSAAYEEAVKRETAAVLAYLRVASSTRLATDAGDLGRSRVIPNLLESYEKAFSFVLDDTFISVEGPQKSIGYNPHEFAHAVTNPLSYDPRWAKRQARAAVLLPIAREALRNDKSTASVAAFMDECLVRAVSLRYLARGDPVRRQKLEKAMLEEYRQGYILERFFWEQLAIFETRPGSLAQAYPHMLDKLDPEAELRRWRAARQG